MITEAKFNEETKELDYKKITPKTWAQDFLMDLISQYNYRLEARDLHGLDKMTIADIAIWRLLGWLTSGIIDGIPTSVVDEFPKLKNIHHQVHRHPKVQEWMLKTYGKEI